MPEKKPPLNTHILGKKKKKHTSEVPNQAGSGQGVHLWANRQGLQALQSHVGHELKILFQHYQ